MGQRGSSLAQNATLGGCAKTNKTKFSFLPELPLNTYYTEIILSIDFPQIVRFAKISAKKGQSEGYECTAFLLCVHLLFVLESRKSLKPTDKKVLTHKQQSQMHFRQAFFVLATSQ